MIEFTDVHKYDTGRRSSKGNQFKFRLDDRWYKADYLGYEGLAEYVVSELLALSSLDDSEYTRYGLEQIKYKNVVFNGCVSKDFAGPWNLITLERLFKNVYGQSLNRIIFTIDDHTERLKTMVDLVERATSIKGFGIYMNKMLTIDAIFLNEDRHTNNIAIMTNGTEYRLAPIFDNGAALLSDTRMDYPLTDDTYSLINDVKPKTFCDSFTEQLEISESLYGHNIRFEYGYNEVEAIINKATIYDEQIRKRVIDVIMETRRRYSYLFG